MSIPHPGFYSSPVPDRASTAWRSPHESFISIRAAQTADLDSVTDVLAASFHPQEGMWGWMYPVFRMGIYEDLRMRLRFNPKHYTCLVAVEQPTDPVARGDRPTVVATAEIGVRSPLVWSKPDETCLYVSNLAVATPYRQRGIARQLLETCDHLATEWGYTDIYLHVLENNHPARRLYRRAGYRLQRVETNLTGWLLGRPRQLYLRKQLNHA